MHIYLAVVAFASPRSPQPVATRVVVIGHATTHEIGPHCASHRTRVRMGCVCGKPAAYDDHATPEERRARALQAAENRSQASDRRGIKNESMVKKVRASQSVKVASGTTTFEDRKSAQMARDWAS